MLEKPVPLAVFCDFDGTLTDVDVVDGLVFKFAKNKRWMKFEEEWTAGEISSDVCMKKQLQSIRISPAELDVYLGSIQLDRGLLPLLDYLDSKNIPFFVLSDGFDLFIQKILDRARIASIRFQSNTIKLQNKVLVPGFPHKKKSCRRCANCKRVILSGQRSKVDCLVFIGDGQSDICAVEVADVVFAKDKLAEHCRKEKIHYYPFKTLLDVKESIPQILNDFERPLLEGSCEKNTHEFR